MKKFLLLALAVGLPTGLSAEAPSNAELPLGTEYVLVIDAPIAAADPACTPSTDCVTMNRAVLTGHMELVPVRSRARWM